MASGVAVRKLDRFHQQAVLLAFPSAPAVHPLDETAEACAAIIGGHNSRIYWNIVQKGLATRAGMFREEFDDFSMIAMFGLSEPENCEELLDAMRREAAHITSGGVEPREIQRVKNLRRTSLANESEAPYYRLGQLVDDMDYHGAPKPAEERLAAVDAVSDRSIAEYLRAFPITGDGFLASVGPREWPGGDHVNEHC
jgi:predicted Zn-dependent peptidase